MSKSQRYQQNIIIVDAFQWDGDTNLSKYPIWFERQVKAGNIRFWYTHPTQSPDTELRDSEKMHIYIGVFTIDPVSNVGYGPSRCLVANRGDWIVYSYLYQSIYTLTPEIFNMMHRN